MLKIKLVSSLEKAFPDQKIDEFEKLCSISALRGERLSLQLLYTDEGEPHTPTRAHGHLELSGELAKHTTVKDVRNVPVDYPLYNGRSDEQYLRTTPGVYPDLLTEQRYRGLTVIQPYLRSVWLEINVPTDFAGKTELRATLSYANVSNVAFAELDGTEEWVSATDAIAIDVIDAEMPSDGMTFTQWFYCDGLANYYNVEVWSERHWEIVENFAKVAMKYNRNTLLMPLLTPALNTFPGFERTPTQLVGVKVEGGKYSFDFTNVERWIDMCERIGVKYYEISHFYEQDKAKHSAKVYGTVDGEYGRIFGWETLALDGEYQKFLHALIPEFIAVMKRRGHDKECLYHISDEPSKETLEHYLAVKNAIAPLLDGYVITDALSNIEFYNSGAVMHPVPTTSDAMDFIEAGVENLFVYYACNEVINYSNCCVAMPSWRTRSIGMQLYKYNVAGFLHWGFNYYNNRGSGDGINPYIELSGESWVAAGDTFAVYPGQDGNPELSIRLIVLGDAIADVSAMRLCERYYSHERVVEEIEKILGGELTFKRCAYSAREMLAVRERINEMIKEAIK